MIFKWLWGKPKVDYSKTPVPGSCPVCRMTVFGTTFLRGFKDWKDPEMAPRWWCQYCNSWFTWDAESRIVRNVETRFMHGLMGNVDIASINKGMGNKYIDPKLPDEFDPPSYRHEKHFKDS